MHYPIYRIVHTTAFVTPVVEHWLKREIAQWVRPMKDRSDDPSHHERTTGGLKPGVHCSSYVDDFQICYRLSSMSIIERQLCTALNKLQQWASDNSFRFSKTKKSVYISARKKVSIWIFQPVLHSANKDRGMFYPVCGMVHIQ